MEEKHATLYPNPNDISEEQRHSALVAIGFSPAAPPPSYDMATNDNNTQQQQYGQQQQHNVSLASGNIAAHSMQQAHTQQQYQQPITDQPRRINGLSKLGPDPCNVTCPSCGVAATTRMTFTPNTRTHLSALILGLVGSCCCACVIPYCMNSCRTGNHYCGHCNAFLGVYNPKIR